MNDINPNPAPRETAEAMLRDVGVLYSHAEYVTVIAWLLGRLEAFERHVKESHAC